MPTTRVINRHYDVGVEEITIYDITCVQVCDGLYRLEDKRTKKQMPFGAIKATDLAKHRMGPRKPRDDGRERHMLIVSPQMAIMLCVEGCLTPSDFVQAMSGASFTDLPKVEVGDEILRLRIMNRTDSATFVTLVDCEGVEL